MTLLWNYFIILFNGCFAPKLTLKGSRERMEFLFNEVLWLFERGIRIIDLIVLGVCLLLIVFFLIFICRDMAKQRRLRRAATETTTETSYDGTDVNDTSIAENIKTDKKEKSLVKKEEKEQKRLAKLEQKQEKQAKKDAKKKKVIAPQLPVDPIVLLLGFDPYAPIENETCEITESFYDVEQETEDMRILRERIQTARVTEKKLATLRQRSIKVKYEQEKTARYIRDNKIVLASAGAVDSKLRDELSVLVVDKKTERRNKVSVATLRVEITKNEQSIHSLSKKVDARVNDEKLLSDAFRYLTAEIARTERDLSFINSDIDRLNVTVGAELKRIENENRARELMNKYRELKPLLYNVNILFADIKSVDKDLEIVHEQKTAFKNELGQLMEEFKRTFGATATQEVASKISKINAGIVELDEKEEELIRKKEELIAKFRQAKTKANDFLTAEKYDIEDIIIAEDKVVGEIEFEKTKNEYEDKRSKTANEYVVAQQKYDALASKKVKFTKKQEAQKRAYEEQLSQALGELKQARSASEKAENDCEKVLPTITPESLIVSGSGVMSRDRLSKRSDENKDRREQDRERARRTVEQNERTESEQVVPSQPTTQKDNRSTVRPVRSSSANLPAMPGARSGKYAQLLARLDELEKLAKEEKRQRELQRRRASTVPDGDKIERKKAELIAMRKELKFINSPTSANEFKRKLHTFALSLDEDEMRDNLLNEMIHRTMNEAMALGERGNN